VPTSDGETRRLKESQAALYEASQLFLGQNDANAILDITCRLVVDHFGLKLAWAGMVHEDSVAVQPVSAYGYSAGYLDSIQVTWDDSPNGRGPTGMAIRSGRAVVTNEIETDPAYAPWREAARSRGYHSSAALPLLAGQRVLGALNVYSTDPGYFSEEEVQALQSLANLAAIAIENARLYQETRRHNRELLLLNRVIAASASAGMEVEILLEVICQELAQILGVSRSMATLFDEKKAVARIVAEYREEGQPPALGQTASVADNPLLQHLLKNKAPLLVNNVQTDARLESLRDEMRLRSTVSLLLLPLLVQNQVVGLLELDAAESRPFSTEEIDLAERVAAQAASVLARAQLIETQQRLSTAVEQAAESIVITDAQGIILYVNPAFERISGYEGSEAIGQNLFSLRNGERQAACPERYWQTLSAGQVWQGRFVSKKKDGTPFTEEATITPVRNPAGEIVSTIATMRDVTREIQLEEQFHRAQKMEAIDRLAGGIAHDFNNLLTVIHLSTRLLEHGLRSEDPLRQHVQRIQDSGARATQLVKQLLTFSRREIIEAQVLNLNQVINDLSLMLQRIIGEDIKLRIELADDLWPVMADPSQIEQVIMNLVVNARDAMPRGGTLAIQTTNVILDAAYAALHVDAQPGDYAMLSISDTGIGMNQEVKSHLFEPFFTTKERGKGTGLGLATVFGIVKQSQGHVQVYSEVGFGTTFRIYLPRAKAEVEVEVKAKAEASTSALTSSMETILLVEDDAAVRDLTVQVLASHGYRVLAAQDGGEALQISADHDGPIHLLLTDMIMPTISGRELAERIRAQRPEVLVLYTSGYTQDAILSQGVLGEGAAFLSKPLTITSLTQAIQAMLKESA
jgi:PAS domain S-box-containing protein